MNDFVIADPGKCIGCQTCEIACVLAHQERPDLDALTPENFAARLTVVKTANITAPIQCRQCEDAPCAKACVKGALVQGAHSVEIKEEECIGCKACMLACPYGAIEIRVNKETNKLSVVKCDLCKGNENGPACIGVCPTKALKQIKHDNFSKQIMRKRKYAAGFMQG
ncbi:4Fe-4S dicluster domain-containing protein [Anaerosinus massiliensis]|uniref:4Fe-4S dicluster domain-containing protein n=1 Tax=Massilibacillus massiliensis TaxID=1806837 RepID=UPI000A6B9CED|nr:4Fe-4S dicluster domain-containing protein [Massilibacillus massiliensis]